jgi:hypothetical protein
MPVDVVRRVPGRKTESTRPRATNERGETGFDGLKFDFG